MIRLLLVCFMSFLALNAAESLEKTLVIIKPDAVKARHIGEIINRFEKNNLKIVNLKMVWLTEEQAGNFYSIHKKKPFFKELVSFISSSAIVPIVLEGPKAINKVRELIGATDYRQALPGTIRKDFASSILQNAVHASDSQKTARLEIGFFFD